MKTLITILICFCGTLYSQSGGSVCTNPIPFCTPTTTFSALAGTSAGAGPDYGCLATQPNPIWLYTEVSTPGSMVLQVSGSSDVDVICWGPFSNSNFCSQLTATNTIGCSSSPSNTETITISGATTGQYYAFMVTNPTGTAQIVTITKLSGTAVSCYNVSCGSLTVPTLCYVTPNSAFHHQVFFNESASPVLKYTVIYREGVNNYQWDSIGFVPAGQPGYFLDTNVNCNQQPYQYTIRNRDTCGNIVGYANPHRTIHLQSNIGTNGEVNLSWNNYQGFNYTTQYIFRGTSPSSMTLYAQIAANVLTYTDLAPLSGSSYYKIGIDLPPGCNSTASSGDTLIYSNWRPNTITGIDYLNNNEFLSMYPNPAGASLHIASFEADYTLEITDLLGKTIATHRMSSNDAMLDVSAYHRGLYVIAVTNSKGRFYRKILLE